MLWIVFFALIAVPLVYLWMVYNSLVVAKSRVDESWSGIDVQLKRRVDLIPNLVETVKGYASHEKEVFEKVTAARSALVSAGNAHEKAQADNMLSGALKSLFAVAEAYPELKANENFLHLQQELSDTESKIAYSRQFYNTNAQDYNVKIKVFPNVFVSGALGYASVDYFKAEEGDKASVKVSF